MLAEVVVIATAVAGVLAIGKRVRAITEQVTLQLYILLQVGVLIGEKVLVKEGSIIIQAGIVQV